MNNFKNRLVEDRREIEQGTPKGWRERRRAIERRMPQVEEITFEVWAVFAAKYAKKSVST